MKYKIDHSVSSLHQKTGSIQINVRSNYSQKIVLLVYKSVYPDLKIKTLENYLFSKLVTGFLFIF